MKAALVTAYGHNPQYADAPEPVATEEEIVIDVLAAALAPRVRSQAAGSHYTSTGALPLIPGVDGVGALPDGRQVYFLLPPDTTHGSMAQRVAMDPRRSVVLPEGADPVAVAATMNPAMASWVALRQRAHWRPGGSVLVLGATGSAGRAAVQVAHHLGAAEIVAVGRNATRMSDLTEFGVRRCIELDDDRSAVAAALAEAGARVNVVLDFLWGEPTSLALEAVVPHRADDAQPLTWVQIGSVAGPRSPIPAAALRATNLHLVGSGQGAVTQDTYREEIGALAHEVVAGTIVTPCRVVALSDVSQAWEDAAASPRLVLVP